MSEDGCTHHWLLDPPETLDQEQRVSGYCRNCHRTRSWKTTYYGAYRDTPAILRDPLPYRILEGAQAIPRYY